MNTPTSHNNDANKAAFHSPKTLHKEGSEVGFLAILQEALTLPGVVNAAYRAFRNYSIGNQILAAMQLTSKGLPLSPIASFNAWREKGRIVKKGQKALQLFMPVNVKRKDKGEAPSIEAGEGGGRLRTRKWQDKDGRDAYTTEIVASEMQMLGTKPDDSRQSPARQQAGLQAPHAPAAHDDVPF